MTADRLAALVTRVADALVRATALVLLGLGLLFWTGHARDLVGLHKGLGMLLVLSLLALVALALRARAGRWLPALVGAWALLALALGILQDRLVTGERHWMVEVAHLLVSVGAVGVGSRLAARLRRAGARPVGGEARGAEG